MSQEKPASPISHAHTVEPLKDGKLADASRNLNQQFERANHAQSDRTQSGQAQIKAPQPVPQMHLKPGEPLKAQVDRPIFQQEMSAYAKHMKELNDSAKARNSMEKQLELKNERGKDHD